jgi:hypothetical protein
MQSFLRRSATCGYENNAFQAFHLIQVDKQFSLKSFPCSGISFQQKTIRTFIVEKKFQLVKQGALSAC